MLRVFLLLSVVFLVGCAPTPEQLGFSEHQWNTFPQSQRDKITADYQKVKERGRQVVLVKAGPDLSVDLADGTAMMPPFIKAYRFETTQFKIQAGACQSVLLQRVDAQQNVTMMACYDGLTLSLDPSPYRLDERLGTLHLTYTPVWQRGFTYRGVNTRGYVRLQDTKVTVKTVAGSAAPVEEETGVSVANHG